MDGCQTIVSAFVVVMLCATIPRDRRMLLEWMLMVNGEAIEGFNQLACSHVFVAFAVTSKHKVFQAFGQFRRNTIMEAGYIIQQIGMSICSLGNVL